MDYIQTSAVDKMAKFIDKGLDPNYQDSDTGGKSRKLETDPQCCLLPPHCTSLYVVLQQQQDAARSQSAHHVTEKVFAQIHITMQK